MSLGAFSVSLAVNDIAESRSFYEKLGFVAAGGDADQNWLIMANGDCVIGLFQGMFNQNVLTFCPGWDQQARALEGFEDVRTIRDRLKEVGISVSDESGDPESGPASFMVFDPDGNPILFDQHV